MDGFSFSETRAAELDDQLDAQPHRAVVRVPRRTRTICLSHDRHQQYHAGASVFFLNHIYTSIAAFLRSITFPQLDFISICLRLL